LKELFRKLLLQKAQTKPVLTTSHHSPILIFAIKTCTIEDFIICNVPRHFLTSRQSKKNPKTVVGASGNSGRDQSQKIFQQNNNSQKILQDNNTFEFEYQCKLV